MGAGASSSSAVAAAPIFSTFTLKKLPDLVEEAIYVKEKFCLIIDKNELASRYLKYQLGSFIASDDPAHYNAQYLNRALVGALRYGRTLTIKFPTLEGLTLDSAIFQKGLFPREVLDRKQFLQPQVWQSVLKPELDDPPPEDMSVSTEFVFILCVTQSDHVPPELVSCMHVFGISDQPAKGKGEAAGAEGDEGQDLMESMAEMFGAAEVVRNSPQLVECAFDGDLEGVKDWLEKGFHLESCDGRKHTALSEAACQGHASLCAYLIELGANPNALSDTLRSPLWRACFSGHLETAKLLLEAGSNPEYRDKVSMESAFDVARNDELRALLSGWDQQRTEVLMAGRKRAMLVRLEERIVTSQQREEYARHKIRAELVAKAEAGDVEGIKSILLMVADEAEKSGQRPRATAETRSETGQSLLSIAAQCDQTDLAIFLLTHYKSCDKDRWDLAEGEMSVEAKVTKANVNSRDLKGWNCTCIAVFHRSLKVLRILLENGGDCTMRSHYNKNAHDLAKDELDAALGVVTDRSEIRAVIVEYDQGPGSAASQGRGLFGKSGTASVKREADMYLDLGHDGSPVVMQLELAKDLESKDKSGEKAKDASKAGGKGGGKKKTSTKNK